MHTPKRGAMRVAALTAALTAALACQGARAQLAVIDVASLRQLLEQVQTLAQQLTTARAQLAQAQGLYQSITGNRGMQRLLSSANPNYLPTDWAQLGAAMQGAGTYGALAGAVTSALGSNAVLSAAQLATLSGDEQAAIGAARQCVALLQALAQQALGNASGRFNDIQQLGAAIGAAPDQKSILELQAALGTEGSLLQNEQIKLQVLFQAAQSEQAAANERERELVVAGQGSFATRFEPSPP
jgi:type IV secretion system protein VirB5